MAVSTFGRRVSESQGRIRTNLSIALLDTRGARPCCEIAISAAELTAGSGEKAKPSAASRIASLSEFASAPAMVAWCSAGKAAVVVVSSA
jgi:hypothetical protein